MTVVKTQSAQVSIDGDIPSEWGPGNVLEGLWNKIGRKNFSKTRRETVHIYPAGPRTVARKNAPGKASHLQPLSIQPTNLSQEIGVF